MKMRTKQAVAVITAGLFLGAANTAAIAGSNTYFFSNDHLGTPQVLTDDNGSVVWEANYKPFGEVVLAKAEVEQPLRFPGQYFDNETGLHYNYFRTYEPVVGRYTQADPIGLDDVRYSAYTYAKVAPVAIIDPSGLLSEMPEVDPIHWTAQG